MTNKLTISVTHTIRHDAAGYYVVERISDTPGETHYGPCPTLELAIAIRSELKEKFSRTCAEVTKAIMDKPILPRDANLTATEINDLIKAYKGPLPGDCLVEEAASKIVERATTSTSHKP